MKKIEKVVVVMGGLSSEREISFQSGKGVAQALKQKGYTVLEIDLTNNIASFVQQLNTFKPDVVFNALHGRYGEDGCIQGMLNLMQIPYTHSGVQASAIGMDKNKTRQLAESLHIPVAKGGLKSKQDLQNQMPDLPYVVKPNDDGSSFGVQIIRTPQEHEQLLKDWPDVEYQLVEEYITGRELSFAILNNQYLGSVELVPESGFYDFENKYTAGKTQHLIPAPLPKEQEELAAQYSLQIHQALGCRGTTRCDFRYDDTNPSQPKLVFLEINTNPGMTPFSLVPDIAKSKKIAYDELVDKIVREAQCD